MGKLCLASPLLRGSVPRGRAHGSALVGAQCQPSLPLVHKAGAELAKHAFQRKHHLANSPDALYTSSLAVRAG